MSSDLASPCRFLEWDSEFFRRRIASVSSVPLDAAGFERAMAWCRDQRIDCAYLLSDAGDAATRRLAEDHRFRLVDIRVTLSLARSEREPLHAPPANPAVRLARIADIAELRALAATSHTRTRFFSDECFDRAACAELYSKWIENGVRGQAEAVWVIEHDGRAAGYLSCHVRAGGRGEIGLFAVAPVVQGRGLGRALLDRGTSWLLEQGCTEVVVVTQGSSLAALRLYGSMGFLTAAVQLWHHRWFDSGGGLNT